jgi:GNAT superfamily N-acetyltransferase
MGEITVQQVKTKADMNRFIRLPWAVYAGDANWRPPLVMDRQDLFNPKTNPYFAHADVAFFLATQNGEPVGRISAQVDRLVGEHMGAGTGQFGCFEALDRPGVAEALFQTAETWLRQKGMTRAIGPFSLSVWDEPGLLVDGFTTPPLLMMGHAPKRYGALVEAQGYAPIKTLYAYDLDITVPFPDGILRIVAAGDKNSRIKLRNADKSKFDQEVTTILGILNDAWADNWGYIPLTPAEIAKAAKQLKPIVVPELVRICEYDGEPAAFMITLPDLNEMTLDLNGSLLPFGWAKLLWRLKHPRTKRVRVPLMGVLKKHQSSRHGALMAMMLIEHIKRATRAQIGATNGELSWILEDNLPMRNILESIGCTIYKTYKIYEKAL